MPWWAILIEGILLVILGLLIVVSPGISTLILIQFMGIYWLIAGIFKIVSIFLDKNGWIWKLVGGILGIIAGLIVIQHPLWSTVLVGSTLILIIAIQAIVFGLVGVMQAFQGGGWGAAVLGVVSLLFGLLLMFNIWGFALALPITIGMLAIIGGIVSIFGAFQSRSANAY